MAGMEFITPIVPWKSIGQTDGIDNAALQKAGTATGNVFGDVFQNMVKQVEETQLDVENKQYLLATGQLDDVHSLPIAEAKAALSIEMLVTLRNKALESYNELMKISV